jgi:phospholipid/cholesterol/gamma-HCH transport system ATP-binding protein
MSESLIDVKKLSKSFDGKVVLSNLDFSVEKGDSYVIIGGSGTGKSVLLKCIMGLLQPDSGEIFFKGVNVTNKSTAVRQKELKFGMLFQGGALFDSLKIWENVAFGLIEGDNLPKKEAKNIAMEKIKAVELDESVAELYPSELSGGMQKRAALARAIATNPDIIFFDEPTTGLDPIVSRKINDLIRKCVDDLGATAITITHDMNSVRTIATKVGLLFEGSLIWQGGVKELDHAKDPHLHQFINGLADGPFTAS